MHVSVALAAFSVFVIHLYYQRRLREKLKVESGESILNPGTDS